MRRARSLAACVGMACLVLLPAPVAGADEPHWKSRPLSHWKSQLRDGDAGAREAAALAVAELAIAQGSDVVTSTVPLLVQCLDSNGPMLRAAAAGALEQIGPAAASGVPRLLTLFDQDPEPTVRRRAGLALARIAPGEPSVITAAARALDGDATDPAREAGAVVLLAAGPAAEMARPQLLSALAESDATVRIFLAGAVAQIGDTNRAVPVLLTGLSHEDAVVRAESAGMLADVAPAHPDAVPSLIQVLADPDWAVRLAAADALGTIGAPARSAVSSLWRLVRDPNEAVSHGALRAIRLIRE